MSNEAIVFSKYLGINYSDEALYNRYDAGVQQLNLNLNLKEESLLKLALKNNFLLPFIDGGLALLRPNCSIRRRILLMSALIETDTKHVHQFISETDSNFSSVKILLRGSIAISKGILGVFLLALLKWR